MNRVVTLAANGLFAASLAILPISAFAQGGTASPSTDSKAPVATGTVMTPSAKITAAAPAKDATKTTEAAKTDAAKTGAATTGTAVTGKDAAKHEVGKTSSMAPATTGGAKVTTAPATPKTGG